ncbi:ATP-dependent DNA helicase DinG [Lysinibacillus sp. SGAir0095]|uniref:ATP-dependent DNA helicase DinG n=1 Tax=Lysinibacillus sp. SGAir0095 TaxID=2070463 RepID=UPI0010CD5203|nr:ATP-dependent DNA helicase DinG [Lysinibacillus sp. SGAir0095]QCR32190.1 ATP-dependent helicase DinG [Lysinibacillus sp. SGAir0095]
MVESQKYAIVDIETTGHSQANGDRMIQIAIVIMEDWCIKKTFTSFIHPGKSIPLFIQDLTNITDTDVQDALPFEAHADYIYELLQDAVFVAHNTDFDLSFLQGEFKRVGLPNWSGKKIDTVELSKILFPSSISYKLGDLAADLNIPLNNAHRADDDALACALLLKECWKELLALPQVTLEQMHKKSFRLKSNISQLFFEALQIKRNKVAKEDDYVYYNKLALKKPMKIEKVVQDTLVYPHTTSEKVGLFKQALPHFEVRQGQFEMMDIIWENLKSKSEIMIEASTGIGKTIGYLMPSILYAIQSNRKVCISTYTTNLLEQLLTNEVPKVEKIMGRPINVTLLKGKKNYVDVILFEQLMKSQELSYDETLTVLQVLVWLSKTETGDLSELNCSGGGQLFVDKIRKNGESIQQKQAFDYYDRAIKESVEADLIITNHSMLLADLVRHEPIFDEIGGWIIDEAHQFVQAAEQHDQAIFTFTNWKYIFGRIGLSTDQELFSSFQKIAVKKQRVPLKIFHQLEKIFIRLVELFDKTMQDIVVQMKVFSKNPKSNLKRIEFIHELSLNREYILDFSKAMQHWIDLAEQVSTLFKRDIEQIAPEHKLVLEQWDYWIREYKMKASEWDEIFLKTDEEYTTWIEIDRRNIPGSIRVLKKPISISSTIEQLFHPIRQKSAVIWTSGTLAVPNNERFIAKQLGINKDVPLKILQAPKQYYKGAKAYIVNDMPEIQAVSQSDYIESVALSITQIVRSTEGRCFVLFTSLDMLRKTVELIQESELLDDYMIFAQGVTNGSRMRLLKSFQKFSHSVLFGTNSFWEGVDVPGDGLSSVVVVRLPFSAPDEPSFKAKSTVLQQQGKNAFSELSLPEAILRFKQGFGRLIRSSEDKGVFVVLDRRIETKSYGVEFLRAIPQISFTKLPLQDMVLEIEHWYNSKDEERKQVDNHDI